MEKLQPADATYAKIMGTIFVILSVIIAAIWLWAPMPWLSHVGLAMMPAGILVLLGDSLTSGDPDRSKVIPIGLIISLGGLGVTVLGGLASF